MKLGHNGLPKAPSGTQPDLTGLSCRWSHMKARSGTILSIVIEQVEGSNIDDFTKLCRQVLDRVHQLDQGGHPAPVESLGIKWPLQGSKLGAHVCRAGMGFAKRHRLVLKETALAWLLFKVSYA